MKKIEVIIKPFKLEDVKRCTSRSWNNRYECI